MYGASTSAFNQAIKRNEDRFPADFMFQLTLEEASLLKSQSVTSSWDGRRKLPYAFTEHGALQAANVLRLNRAITMSVYIVRAFIRMREALASHRDLARRRDRIATHGPSHWAGRPRTRRCECCGRGDEARSPKRCCRPAPGCRAGCKSERMGCKWGKRRR